MTADRKKTGMYIKDVPFVWEYVKITSPEHVREMALSKFRENLMSWRGEIIEFIHSKWDSWTEEDRKAYRDIATRIMNFLCSEQHDVDTLEGPQHRKKAEERTNELVKRTMHRLARQ